MKRKNDIVFGMLLLGTTGVLIGVVLDSDMLAVIAGGLGLALGGLVGWVGGRRYMIIVCLGVLIGTFFGYRSGDRDILIMAAGAGGAIAGFVGAQVELFLRKR